MKCGEAKLAEDLAYDNDDNIDCHNISKNIPSAVNVPVLGSGTTCKDPHIKLTTGQSKWIKFMKNTNSSRDDGKVGFLCNNPLLLIMLITNCRLQSKTIVCIE